MEATPCTQSTAECPCQFGRHSDQKAMEQARPKRRWKSQAAHDTISAPMDLGGYTSHDPQGLEDQSAETCETLHPSVP